MDDTNPEPSTPILLPHYIALPLTLSTLRGTCYILQCRSNRTTGGIFIFLEAGITFLILLSAAGLATRQALSFVNITPRTRIPNQTIEAREAKRHIQGLQAITDAQATQPTKPHPRPIGRYPSTTSTNAFTDLSSASAVTSLANNQGSPHHPSTTPSLSSSALSPRSNSTTPPASPLRPLLSPPNIAYASNPDSHHTPAITFAPEALTERNAAWLHGADAFDALSAGLGTSRSMETAVEGLTRDGGTMAWQDVDWEERMRAWVDEIVEEGLGGVGERSRHAFDEEFGAGGYEEDLEEELEEEFDEELDEEVDEEVEDEEKEEEKRERSMLRKKAPEDKNSGEKGRQRNVLRKEKKAAR
ncbi:hypothetical protein K505DRAFT_340860 [Melanomma pulvis-pyrius CBS 109.77]|uniref:Uncharacterized protein n=1 Tax=Melanomma pulvis-pyrius CBS 109.77 TaxID=1314802 RepID=A0A6A6X179_9PLEO|nr:hypothetical protein K505DRAFT_340860 [Melanomma pulvis-pyrius CBS 109.77]